MKLTLVIMASWRFGPITWSYFFFFSLQIYFYLRVAIVYFNFSKVFDLGPFDISIIKAQITYIKNRIVDIYEVWLIIGNY